MANWTVINIDRDIQSWNIVEFTAAMKVPGGMIIRSVVQDHGVSMVFIPGKDHVPGADVASTWIEDNKVI